MNENSQHSQPQPSQPQIQKVGSAKISKVAVTHPIPAPLAKAYAGKQHAALAALMGSLGYTAKDGIREGHYCVA